MAAPRLALDAMIWPPPPLYCQSPPAGTCALEPRSGATNWVVGSVGERVAACPPAAVPATRWSVAMSAALSAARARGAAAWAPPLRASRIVETTSELPARRTPRTCVRPATFTRALNRVALPLPAEAPVSARASSRPVASAEAELRSRTSTSVARRFETV